MIETLADMRNQQNKQNQIIPIDASAKPFHINGKNVSVTENGIRMRNIIYNFSKGCSMFCL